jgi:hypothetical protein
VGSPGEIIRPTDVDRRATAFDESAWGGPIIAIASIRLDRLKIVRDAREWTPRTYCTGTGAAQRVRMLHLRERRVRSPVPRPDPYESRPTGARTRASEGRRIGRHRKERRT